MNNDQVRSDMTQAPNVEARLQEVDDAFLESLGGQRQTSAAFDNGFDNGFDNALN